MIENPESIILILLVCGFVGIISGSYPALALSAIKPISVLKGSFVKAANKSFMRNILVVTQFVISGCLITSALIIIQQLNYIQHKDMGYSRDHIINLHINDWDFVSKVSVFKEELMKVAGVLQVTSSSNLPNNITNLSVIAWPNKPDEIGWDIYGGRAGFDFTELYNIEIVEGRTFSRMEGDENGAVLINESAARLLPWDDPIGRELIRWRDTCRIVGVMKDFHQHSLHQEIMPLQLFFNENERKISIKISGDDIEQTLAGIKKTKEEFSKKYPFDYMFFDDEFDKAYKSELKTAKLANWSTLITIIIACMGLYGLATFISEQRIKEVGIRKVLGAKVFHLVFLLSRDFTLLVMISFVISAPIAYYLMRQWLSDFAYHISIGLQTFIGTLFIMILISWITVGYQTFRVAISNPIKALKDE
jgi:putative ABC transport system permease protein